MIAPSVKSLNDRGDDGGVKINHQIVVFDAADLAAESSFWAGVLGGTVDAEDDWHMVEVDGQPRIGVQLASAE
jgi:Glyoxalase-like domain